MLDISPKTSEIGCEEIGLNKNTDLYFVQAGVSNLISVFLTHKTNQSSD